MKNKPKLFEDYVNKVADLALPIPRDDSDWLSIERTASSEMLDDLATKIHELNEKMDWVIKRGVGEVYKMEEVANGTLEKTLSCYLPFKEVKDYFGENLKKKNNESI